MPGQERLLPSDRVGGLRRYAGLVATLAEREFLSAYRGNLTGALSSFIVPLVMLATYTFVFSILIPIRIRPEQSKLDYGFFLFSGLIAWNLFADVASRAPRLFVDSPNYVTRPLFPVSAIAASPCLASFYRALPWLLAFVAARWLLFGELPATALLAPIALAWTSLLVLGVVLVLACLGALVRELGALVPAGLTLLFFLTPVIYLQETIDRVSPWVGRLNPMAEPVLVLRGLLFDGVLPGPELLLLSLASTLFWVGLGWALYRFTRPLLQDLV